MSLEKNHTLKRRRLIMRGRKEDEGHEEGTEVEQPVKGEKEVEEDVVEQEGVEENVAEQEEVEKSIKEQEEVEEISLAKVDVVTSEKKMTVSTPVKEYDDFKNSFKNMMVAFTNLIEATGLEIGQDETITTINMLMLDLDQMKKDLESEKAKIRDELVPRSEFDELKATTTEEEAKIREQYVPRSEFEDLKTSTEERAARASEDYVTRGEFERFRAAVREVI
jgi:hypothetical protein